MPKCRKGITILIALCFFLQTKGEMEREQCTCSCTQGNANICDYVRTIDRGIETLQKNLGDEANKLKSDFEKHVADVQTKLTAHFENKLQIATSQLDTTMEGIANTMKKEYEDRLKKVEAEVRKMKTEEGHKIRKLEEELNTEMKKQIDDLKEFVNTLTTSLEERLIIKSKEIAKEELQPLEKSIAESRMKINVLEKQLEANLAGLQSVESSLEIMKKDVQANYYEILRSKVQMSRLQKTDNF